MYLKNKKAYFNFEVLEKETAGILLTGTEVKSIRDNKVNFNDSFCSFTDNELFIRNLHISEYENGTYLNHDPLRIRKLLLTKKQIKKWSDKVKQKGLSIVPLSIFINDKGFVKLEIGLVKGKKMYDKRESLKKKDQNRQIERIIK